MGRNKGKTYYIGGKILEQGTTLGVSQECNNGFRYCNLGGDCIAHYKLNDHLSTIVIDDSAPPNSYNSDGTVSYNCLLFGASAGGTAAISTSGVTGFGPDYALNLNGTSHRIYRVDTTQFNNIKSVSTWVKFDTFEAIGGGHATLFAKQKNSDEDKRIAVNKDGRLYVLFKAEGINYDYYADASDGVLSTGVWYHVVVNFNYTPSYSTTIYVNGIDVSSSDTVSSGSRPVTTAVYFGALTPIDGFLDGSIDNICCFGKTLSSYEVSALYNEGYGNENLTGCGCYGNSTSNLSTGMVAHYKLNENFSTSTIYDDSGNSNNGTLYAGAAPISTNSLSETGKIRRALHLDDGVYHHVHIPHHSDFGATTQVSISCWVNLDSVGTAYGFVSKSPDGSGNAVNYTLEIGSSGLISFYGYFSENPYGIIEQTHGTIYAGRWYHIVGVFDYDATDGQWKLYINGGLQISVDEGVSLYATTGDIYIGYRTDSSPLYFNGKIDEVAIWNRALTTCEVGTLYNYGAGTEMLLENGCCPEVSSSSKSSSSSSKSSSSKSSSSSSKSSSSSSSSSSIPPFSSSSSSTSSSSSSRSSSSSSSRSSSSSSISSRSSSSSSSVSSTTACTNTVVCFGTQGPYSLDITFSGITNCPGYSYTPNGTYTCNYSYDDVNAWATASVFLWEGNPESGYGIYLSVGIIHWSDIEENGTLANKYTLYVSFVDTQSGITHNIFRHAYEMDSHDENDWVYFPSCENFETDSFNSYLIAEYCDIYEGCYGGTFQLDFGACSITVSSSSSSSSSRSSSSSSRSSSSSSSVVTAVHGSGSGSLHGGGGFVFPDYDLKNIDELYKKYSPSMKGKTQLEKEDFIINLVSSGEITADQALMLAIREKIDLTA